MREEFTSIASHELKTPITSIKMQIQMAKHRLTTDKEQADINKQMRALQVAERQIDKLTELVDDLLDVSRIQSGKMSYYFEKMNFAEMFDDVVDRFAQQLASSKNDLKLYIDEKIEGYWDRTRLEQVMVNLISNAIKYAPGTPIVVFGRQSGNRVIVSIQDFGPGIPSDRQGLIFKRFERLGQSRSVGGLGLGLFISKEIINAHGGQIEMKSSADEGATFIVTLPLDSRIFQN